MMSTSTKEAGNREDTGGTSFLKVSKRQGRKSAPMLMQGCVSNTHVFKRDAE